jgi:hypothetical protein
MERDLCVALLFFWLFGIFITAAIGFVVRFFFDKARAPQKVEQSIRQQTADIPAGNYLFLRCSGDEAAAALSAAQFIAWLGVWFFTKLGLLTRPLFNAGRPKAQAISWTVLLVIVYPAFAKGSLVMLPGIIKSGFGHLLWPDWSYLATLDYWHKPIEFLFMILIMGHTVYNLVSFVVVCLFLLCLLAVFLILLTQALTSWAFGWTRLFTGFLVELAIEPLPFGAHSLTHIDWAAGSTGLDGIVHSWTYAHPVAIMHLQTWVSGHITKGGNAGAVADPIEIGINQTPGLEVSSRLLVGTTR